MGKKMTGAEILVDCLVREGVEVAFGYPGGMILDVLTALILLPSSFTWSGTNKAAGHAADGYARASGKPGGLHCDFGAGRDEHRHRPGHGLYGLGSDHRDLGAGPHGRHRQRCLPGGRHGRDHPAGHQHNFLVKSIQDLPRIIREAFYIATTGGPVPF